MKFVPKEHQRIAIKNILDRPKDGELLDMGLGKTVSTLTAIHELIFDRFEVRKVLVIAPKLVAQETWTAEIEKWDHLHDLKVSVVIGTAKERVAALKVDAHIYTINRENVIWLCELLSSKWDFDMVVIDELSSFKSSTSKRFKVLKKLIPLSSRVVGLTGTPAPNGYGDLYSQIYLLDRGERLGKTLTAFRDSFFRPGKRNGHIVFNWELREGCKEQIDARISDICTSMSAVDWLDMPERLDIEHVVEMDKSQWVTYKQFEKDHVLELVGGEDDIVGVNAAAVTNKLLQMANGFAYTENKEVHAIHDLKLEALEEIKEAAQGNPLLVFYSFKADLARILERFEDAVKLEDAKQIRDWNRGKIPMLVAHPASAGHGLNLQDGGNVIIWVGMPWSLELYQQANARLHRQGQTKTVFVHHLLTKGTMDEDVLAALKRKDTCQKSLIEALKARIENTGRLSR